MLVKGAMIFAVSRSPRPSSSARYCLYGLVGTPWQAVCLGDDLELTIGRNELLNVGESKGPHALLRMSALGH